MLDFEDRVLGIEIYNDYSAKIKFVTETGIVSTGEGISATYDIPQKDSNPSIKYVRTEVEDDSGERLFLQPVMYN